MDYAAHYARLMTRAKRRVLRGYVERHHVVPRCLGGALVRANVVRLTPEEHYVAHQLLVRMHPSDHRLLWAAVAMTNGTTKQPRRNKLYGWLRRKLAATLSKRFTGRVVSTETRALMRAARLGRKMGTRSAETKAKMSAASKGRPKSDAHRAALAAAKLGKKRGPHSEQHRARQSVSISKAMRQLDRSKIYGADYRLKQSEISTAIWARRRAVGKLSALDGSLPTGG